MHAASKPAIRTQIEAALGLHSAGRNLESHPENYCSRIVQRAPGCVEAWHNLRFASGRMMSALQTPAAIATTAGRK